MLVIDRLAHLDAPWPGRAIAVVPPVPQRTVGVPQVCFRDSRTLRLENRSMPASPQGQDTVGRASKLA